MALKVTYNSPAHEKGAEVEVVGLGLLKNGESRTLTDEDELNFFSLHGESVKDKLGKDEMFKVEGTVEVRKSELPDLGGDS